MKHCLIITAYKDVEQLNLLIESTPEDWGIYIHIDKKSSIKLNQIDKRANVYSKYKIYWGGIEHVYAILHLLKEAMSSNYDFYHIISGQDYFACHPEKFDNILKDNKNIYLSCFEIPYVGWKRPWNYGYDIFQNRTLSSLCDVRRRGLFQINKFMIRLQKLLNLKKQLPKMRLYGSAVWGSLNHDSVKWIIESSLSRDLLKNLKNTTCGEEVFFATSLGNSPYRDNLQISHLRYVDWSVNIPPKQLDESDIPNVLSSNNLFCRKTDYKLSLKIKQLLHI